MSDVLLTWSLLQSVLYHSMYCMTYVVSACVLLHDLCRAVPGGRPRTRQVSCLWEPVQLQFSMLPHVWHVGTLLHLCAQMCMCACVSVCVCVCMCVCVCVCDCRYGIDEPNGAPTVVVMYRLLCALREKIMATKAEREARRNFTIENAGEVPTMRAQPPKSNEDNGTAPAA